MANKEQPPVSVTTNAAKRRMADERLNKMKNIVRKKPESVSDTRKERELTQAKEWAGRMKKQYQKEGRWNSRKSKSRSSGRK